MMLEEAGEGSIYRRAPRGGLGTAGGHLDTAPGDERRQSEGEDDGGHTGTVRGIGRAHERGGKRRAQCAVHCAVGRTVHVLAAASFGVGERQRGVMEVDTRMVARCGMLWPAGRRARAQQSVWRHAERVFGMPACSDERGHRMDRDIRPP